MFETKTDKSRTFALLRERNIGRVEVDFSGGNDEGGAEAVRYFDTAGEPIEITYSNAHRAHGMYEEDENGNKWPENTWVVGLNLPGKWMASRLATDEEQKTAELQSLVEAPIYDRYSTFAGEFYVWGTVKWDVATGTVTMGADEEVPTTEHFEGEI